MINGTLSNCHKCRNIKCTCPRQIGGNLELKDIFDKIYMIDSTDGFKTYEYVQGYKQGIREIAERLGVEFIGTKTKESEAKAE